LKESQYDPFFLYNKRNFIGFPTMKRIKILMNSLAIFVGYYIIRSFEKKKPADKVIC